jgi:hypothetical protein
MTSSHAAAGEGPATWGESVRHFRDTKAKLEWPLDSYKAGVVHVHVRDIKASANAGRRVGCVMLLALTMRRSQAKDRVFDPVVQVRKCACVSFEHAAVHACMHVWLTLMRVRRGAMPTHRCFGTVARRRRRGIRRQGRRLRS